MKKVAFPLKMDRSQKPLEKASHEEIALNIDRELRRLQAECLKSGYSATQVERSAACFLKAAEKARREAWLKRVAGVVVVALLCFGVLQFKSPRGFLVYVARTAQIKTLAVWDWTEVYHSNCLLSNPLYSPPDDLTTDHCQVCEGLEPVEHVHNVSGQELIERFFQRDLPVLVEDVLQDWHQNPSVPYTPREVAELFETKESLRTSGGCGFTSSMAAQYGGHRSFLRGLLDRSFTHYYAHWENCQGKAAKVLRTVFPRPEFLPPALQLAPSSWLFLSRDYATSVFKPVEVRHPLVILLQVSGEVKVKLEAWRPCRDLCPALYVTLLPGDSLIITDFLWSLSYLPSSNGESLTVGLGGSF